MPIINFYPRSRGVKAHIDDTGALHICISEWDAYLRSNNSGWQNGYSLNRSSVLALQEQATR